MSLSDVLFIEFSANYVFYFICEKKRLKTLKHDLLSATHVLNYALQRPVFPLPRGRQRLVLKENFKSGWLFSCGIVNNRNIPQRAQAYKVDPRLLLESVSPGPNQKSRHLVYGKAVSVKRRLRTADCRLRTRGKRQTKCKMQTTD